MDAEQFLQATTETATLRDLVAAVDRYRGDFLVRPLYGWCLWYAQTLNERYVAALYRIIELHGNDAQQVATVRLWSCSSLVIRGPMLTIIALTSIFGRMVKQIATVYTCSR